MAFKTATHCIFDMDGLLLDTEPLYTLAISNILSRYGAVFTWEVKAQAMGRTGADSAKFIVNHYNLPITCEDYMEQAAEQYRIKICQKFGGEYTEDVRMKVLGRKEVDVVDIIINDLKLPCTAEMFYKEYRGNFKTILLNATLQPGAERLIRHLHKHNIPIAVATSSSRDSVEIKTKNYQQLFSLFSHLVSGSSDPEVKNGKPSPDIFLVCASKFADKPTSEQCLVFEDAPNGVMAAHSAGMQSVMVPDPRVSEEQRKLATISIASLEDFKPEAFGLPKFADDEDKTQESSSIENGKA